MADNKKSFILYADLIHTVKKMTKEQAGHLLMTMLEYVNDLNPVITDLTIDLVFEPIKQQMKRDLIKWDGIKDKRSQAGKASAEARKVAKDMQQASTISTLVEIDEQTSTNSTVNDTVNVNGTVTVNVNDTVIKKEIDDVDVLPSTSSAFFTIHHLVSEIAFGQNEFTLLATRKTSRTIAELKDLFQEFIAEQRGLTKITWQNAADAKSHFINWVKKQPKAQQSKFVM